MPTTLNDIYYNSVSVEMGVGCTIEYNMNNLIDNISVTAPTQNYTDQIKRVIDGTLQTVPDQRINPFKKLFPVDSIVKPFRPLDSGIKYYIVNSPDISSNSFSNPKSLTYPSDKARIYYPGVTTTYKYWVSPMGGNVDITVQYSDGTTKFALANKIVVNFEKYHSLPTTYSLVITKSDNTQVTAGPFSSASSGMNTIYYNGSTWSNTSPSEPISYPTPIAIKSIQLTATNSGGENIIGVIELSARWIKDISSDIVSFDIQKESSATQDSILPVGNVTANSLILNLTKYGDTVQIINYDRSPSEQFDSSLIYLYKNVELRPYFLTYHADGAITSGSKKYDKTSQGVFYVDTFSIGEYGDSRVSCLDSVKYLTDTVAPEMLCEGYPVTAILRRLLDSVGYTNYNFNLHSTQETSVAFIQYWWTDGTKTVWEAIQELCRDTQMNAVVDNNNILQFYSRDYLYNKTTSNWDFYYAAEGSKKPNIVSIDPQVVASANQVKVLWQVPVKSTYLGSSGGLWSSPTSFLSAGGLRYDIAADSTAENTILIVEFSLLPMYSSQQSIYNFSGYLLIDSEIIEYDAIQYQYVPKESATNAPIGFWATSSSDLNKYRFLSKSGYTDPTKPETAYFRPTGRYRVKTRGALGTTPAFHAATAPNIAANWIERTAAWK